MIHPEQRFNFFSDYSQMVSCPNCGVQEAHFCKNINVYLRREEAEQVTPAGEAKGILHGGKEGGIDRILQHPAH